MSVAELKEVGRLRLAKRKADLKKVKTYLACWLCWVGGFVKPMLKVR